MKCSDIEDKKIVDLLAENPNLPHTWCTDSSPMLSVRPAFPKDASDKLVIAKMKKLIKRGIVDGCGCGCRGDYMFKKYL